MPVLFLTLINMCLQPLSVAKRSISCAATSVRCSYGGGVCVWVTYPPLTAHGWISLLLPTIISGVVCGTALSQYWICFNDLVQSAEYTISIPWNITIQKRGKGYFGSDSRARSNRLTSTLRQIDCDIVWYSFMPAESQICNTRPKKN